MGLVNVLKQDLGTMYPDSVISIEPNKKRGQSETFTVFNSDNQPMCIAKFFDFIDDDKIKKSLGEEYLRKCIDLDEVIDNIETIEDPFADIGQIIDIISLQRRSFKRYIEVCNIDGLKCFPELLFYRQEIKIGNSFYGLLIEEFINGTTLEHSFDGIDTADIHLILDFLEQMGQIFKKLTDNGIVHRDVSPDNIMYADNKYVLIDPGVVKIVDDEPTTKSQYILGKIYYASPEQYSGHAKYVTFSSDLYALGIICLELILKKNPLRELIEEGFHSGKMPHAELLSKYNRKIEDLYYTYMNEDELSTILFVIIKKMVQVDHKLRYDSVDSFILAIKNLRERMDRV